MTERQLPAPALRRLSATTTDWMVLLLVAAWVLAAWQLPDLLRG